MYTHTHSPARARSHTHAHTSLHTVILNNDLDSQHDDAVCELDISFCKYTTILYYNEYYLSSSAALLYYNMHNILCPPMPTYILQLLCVNITLKVNGIYTTLL